MKYHSTYQIERRIHVKRPAKLLHKNMPGKPRARIREIMLNFTKNHVILSAIVKQAGVFAILDAILDLLRVVVEVL